MFRDREKELERIQEQLLEEEEQQPEQEEDLLDEDALDGLLEGSKQTASVGVYKNFSNDYGRTLRNYASGYRAYNTDTADTDLEEYSEAVYQPPKKRPGCVLIPVAIALLAALAVWIWLRMGGSLQ